MGSTFDAMFRLASAPALAATFGVTLTITRGEDSTPDVPATIRKREYEVLNNDAGFTQMVSFFDFVFNVPDYIVKDVVVEPKSGDRLTIGAHIYEALPAGNRPAVEPEDSSRERWLVHTKLIND